MGADGGTHAIDQDFSAAAGQAVEAGGPKALQCLRDADVTELGDVSDLGRRERVDVDGVPLLDACKKAFEPLDAQVGVKPALHHHRRAAKRQRLLDLGVDLVL